jgi:NTE family protein
VLFDPIVVRNFDDCGKSEPPWLVRARERAASEPEMALMVRGVDSYFNKAQRRYAHFVDGGITDNLGLRAMHDIIELSGGAKATVQAFRGGNVPRKIALISVNASTQAVNSMDLSNAEPGLSATISAMSDVQLHRYNVDTIELMEHSLAAWTRELSTPGHPVGSYFVRLDLQQPPDVEERRFLNAVPTSFQLSSEQVDRLIGAGRQLLRDNPEFKRLLSDLAEPAGG